MNTPPLSLFLRRLSLILFCLLVLLVPTTFRAIVWEATPQANLFPEFKGVVLFPIDGVMAALLCLALFQRESRRALFAAIRVSGPPLFIVWAFFSGLWALEPRLSLFAAIHAAAAWLTGVLLAEEMRNGREMPVVSALAFGAVIQALFALAQALRPGPLGLAFLGEILPPPDYNYRGIGLAVHPNNLAGYLLVGLCAVIYLAQKRRAWRVAVIPILLGIFATFSRSAMLAMAVVGFGWWNGKIRWRRWFAIPIVLSILIAAVLLARGGIGHLANLKRPFHFDDAWIVFQQHPILGVGAANSPLASGVFDLTETIYPVHNVYLLMAVELGIIGAALFLWWWGRVLLSRRWESPWWWALVGIAVIMLFDYYWWGDHRSQILLFLVWGLWWGNQPRAPLPYLEYV